MCLAVPLPVIEVSADRQHGKVMMGGAPYEVGLALLDDVNVGDHVLVHAGMAIQRLSPAEAEETLKVFQEFFAVVDREAGAGSCHA
jgi:hydrogenase expression/formation protein HypC